MFSHIMIGANNIEESKKFYDAILGELGIKPGTIDPKGRCFYFTESGVLGLSVPITVSQPVMVMAALLVLMSPILPRAMPGMLQALPMAVLPVKRPPVCALAAIWAICI